MILLKRLKAFRDLFLIFIWREFSIRYKQSIIGIAWAIIQPLSMMLLFTFIFTYIIPVKMSNYPYIVFFYGGSLPWSFFSSALNYSIPSLTNNYNLITKIYFPREILPLSGVIVAAIDFFIATLLYIILLFLFKIKITINILWFPLLFLLLLYFTAAVSIILASLNVYYRDVKLASNFLIQLWFFVTPVFYSIDKLSLKLKILLFLNPLTFIVENMRRCVIEGRSVVWWQFAIMCLFVILVFHFSYKLFLITEKKFADVI